MQPIAKFLSFITLPTDAIKFNTPKVINAVSFHLDTSNGEAGSPSLLYRFAPSGLSAQA
jgi:hypothetical protein